MTSHLISTAMMPQVAGENQARMVPPLANNSGRSPKPHVMDILNSIVTMGRLVQTVHDQVLAHDAFLTSSAEKFEKAYFAEYYKLLQSSATNNAMGRDIEDLRRENAKYKNLEGHSQRLKDDLLACQARYRELDDLNIRIEKENKKLMDVNAEMGKMVVGLRAQVLSLEAKLDEVGYQPLSADNGQEITAQTQADVKDESDLSSISPPNVQLPESLPPSLKRKHSALEDDDEVDSGQEQRKARRRK
ncbi:uncharacterized protein PV09_09778 [Verruconis gallopava]|uniref:Uncharacterized protein n=1 Tax=Verruconis gallopava TaxID=253628 RepID=A0A0D1X8P8_9PEZI|nr:uncharacterized protein PV09_09778 [Verruconis gallopava]KIV98395.1 hypothetical protein PV09_09778 [Verruconis gallopava]